MEKVPESGDNGQAADNCQEPANNPVEDNGET